MTDVRYIAKMPGTDPDGVVLQLDATKYVVVPTSDPMLENFVTIQAVDNPTVRHTLFKSDFESGYEPVDQEDPPTVSIPVQAQDGTQYVLSVQSDGSVTAAPVGNPNS